MQSTYDADEVQVAYHPYGFRIDKTADPLNRYTKWEITDDNQWKNPTPVCFHSMPGKGWIKVDSFDWNTQKAAKE